MSTSKPNPSAGDDPADTLDERKSQILKAIVEEYVATAQPVGSQTVVARRSLDVSAATVRNEMSVLEREGFITQPHTSAGRVPTDRGYRFFVDHFAPISTLPSPQRREVSEFFNSATGVIDQLLHDTSQLLARITRHAAVVVGPTVDATMVRAVHLVPLDTVNVLVIAVLGNGTVEREIVRFDEEIPHPLIERAEVALAHKLVGTELADAVPSEPRTGTGSADDDRPVRAGNADDIARVALDALVGRTTSSEPLFVGGASRLAAESEAFTSPESVSRLLGLLEQHVVVVGMMRELLGPGLTVTIGSEHKRSDLQECSLVLAPYLVDGAFAGTVGVLGPTRMDYRQAQAAVRTISQQLSRELSR
ncbi:MAG TPA: heat-inducible transcriptional repressor HrcA [Acidimicrobiia bacterium]